MAWKFSKEKVIKLRLERGMKQHHLNIKFGIDQAQLDRIEKGLTPNPGVCMICKLCDAFDVSPTALFINE